MKHFKEQTVVISATALILSGLAAAEVLRETNAGQVPGEGRSVPALDSDSTTVPEPYLPETRGSLDQTNRSLDRDFITARTSDDTMSIRSAQEMLKGLGYDIGVDGIAGRETKSALRDFQAANGIAQTGSLDKPTVSALRDASLMNDDRYPASFEDEELPYDSAFPPFPDSPSQTPKSGGAPMPRYR